MINMKRAHKDATMLSDCCANDQPEYPYGLCLSLDDESLQKLGIDQLPDVGTVMHLVARVQVTSVSQYERTDGKNRDISLQITDMELKPDGGQASNPQNLYASSNMN